MSYTPLYSLVNLKNDLYKSPYSQLYPLHTLLRIRVCNGNEKCTIPEEYIPLVNSHDNQGIPPLFYVNCIHDTKWLLQHNANVNYNNFVYSSIQEQYSFLQGCNDLTTILESAVERKHIDVAKILIEHGAKTSTYFVISKTMPISYAAFFRYAN